MGKFTVDRKAMEKNMTKIYTEKRRSFHVKELQSSITMGL